LINKLYKEYKILVVSGVDDSTGGRKPKLYQINKKFGYVIGLDIGGENIRVIITDILGNIISSLRDKINSEKSKEEIISKILSMMDSLIIKSKISKEKILGIGMSISGIINTESGYIIFCPNIEGFKDFHVKKIIEEKTKVQVFIDDSVRCMAIAEKRYGIAKSYNNFIFVSLGKGIGIGVYIDGKIYRGSMGLAGELGHITVSENGPICNCGNRGCLEAIASSDGIIRRVTEGMKKGIVTSLSSAINSNFDNLTVEIIAKAAKDGDKFAYYIINRTGEYVGIAIAAALNLFGSDLIVIGGGVSESGDILLSAIKRTVKTRALDVISKKVAIIKTQLDDNIAALGAATNLIDTLFDNCYEQNILKGV
jgi:glucokinase-like ROK family protein